MCDYKTCEKNVKNKLLDWVDINNLYWNGLSENPNAIHLLEDNMLFLLL